MSVPLQLGLPDAVPPQYGALREVSIHTARARLRLLYHFSDLMYSSWRLLNLSPNNQVTCWLGNSTHDVLAMPRPFSQPLENSFMANTFYSQHLKDVEKATILFPFFVGLVTDQILVIILDTKSFSVCFGLSKPQGRMNG